MIDLDGKTVLVTGGTRGIGAVIVEELVKAGAQVLVHGRTTPTAGPYADGGPGSASTRFISGDLAMPGAGSELWRRALEGGLAIDVLVNNAGIYVPDALEADDEQWTEAWERTMQVNLIAPAELCRAALRSWFAASRGGIIINVASRAAFRGDDPDYGAYAASKAGLVALTKTIARAHAGRGVLAYAVAPGFVRTALTQECFDADPGLESRIRAEIPMGDIVPPVEIARVVCFLASGLVGHATGSTFDLNGASYVR